MDIKESKYPDLAQRIREIHRTKTIPTYTPDGGTLKRYQRKEWPSALNFSHGNGRYNSSTGSFGVYYMADKAVTALAESYGRLLHQGEEAFIDEQDLHTARICLIQPTRKLIFIDIAKLFGMLHITIDVVLSDDYSVTQSATECLYEMLKEEIDGICYLSRHWTTADYCYAVWEKEGDRFVDAGMYSLIDYKDSEYLPEGWTESDITADELLEDVLNFKIIQLE